VKKNKILRTLEIGFFFIYKRNVISREVRGMRVICTKGCNKEFEDPVFKEDKLNGDIREVYFKCPHCNWKYTCFYTDREIRKLQALQRKTKDKKEFNKLKEKVTNRMNKLKEYMKNN